MAEAWWRPAVAEFLGTLTLVFIGAGAVVTLSRVASVTGGGSGAPIVGVALAHGLAIAAMVIALGHLSGAHFNPAVTLAFLFTKRIRADVAAVYIAFQLLGAVAAAFLLVSAFPATWWDVPGVALGTPALAEGVNPAKGVLIEAILTFFLVLVIFGAAVDDRNTTRLMAGLAIGLAITMDILMGGYLTGAALNPARAFGPALISRTWAVQYVYWVGPIIGGLLAALVYDAAFGDPRRKAMATEAAAPSSAGETARADALTPVGARGSRRPAGPGSRGARAPATSRRPSPQRRR